MKNSENTEWISISTLAERLGVTKQTIYNHVKQGMYPTKEFKRGTMRGVLVQVAKSTALEGGNDGKVE